MTHVDIYTDGSCLGNPGAGGWGAILVCKGVEKVISGGEADTTNNRMELTAAIMALKVLNRPCEIKLTTDSKYLCDGLSKGWATSWKNNGWKKSDNKPALNAELWDELLSLIEKHDMTYVWVKGHAGHPYNERCDSLAQTEAAKYRK